MMFIFLKGVIKDNKYIILIGTISLITMFLLFTNTYKMIDVEYLKLISKDTTLMTKDMFSLNIVETLIEYFICGILVFFILENKNYQFKKENTVKKSLFIKNFSALIIIILSSLIIFSIIKFGFILLKSEYFINCAYIKHILKFSFLNLNICLISSSLVYLFNMLIKDRFNSIIFPLLLLQVPFILFALTTYFTSKIFYPIKVIGEFINYIFIDKLILWIITGQKIEIMSNFQFLTFNVFLIFSTIIFIFLSYKLFLRLNTKNTKRDYYFRGIQMFFYINLAIIFSYLTSIFIMVIIMAFNASIELDNLIMIFNILYFILSFLYYGVESVLLKKQECNIIKAS